MDIALRSLNAAQRDAVLSDAQVLQVLAPPGSGKTKTLTARIAHLIAAGLQPWNIIVCTFTVKAAKEMQSRIHDLVGDDTRIKIGTFHGIALRYLRKHKDFAGLSNAFGVADTSDSTAILRRLLKLDGNTMDASTARSRISSLKAKGIDCEAFAQRESKNASQAHFLRLFQAYQAELRRSGLLDYDDILLRCVDLLKAHPECVRDIQAVFVDEFQDTNNVQYELMSLFAQSKQNITIVGDPDQSIYGWRSAEIKNLHRMRQRWQETVTINLEENYRSSGSILKAAQAIIEQDVSRPQKTLQATLAYGHKPILRRLPSARDEALWLVEEIRRLQGLSGGLLGHNDFAILLRTAGLSRVIETTLGSAGLPYRMVGGTKFFDRVEVKLVLDYLRVIDNPAHNEALARVLNVPPRRIGDKTLEGLQSESQRKGVSMWSLVQGLARGRASIAANVTQLAMRGIEQFTNVILTCQKRLQDDQAALVDIVRLVLQKTGMQAYLRGKYVEDFENRWASIEDLVAQASERLPGQDDPAAARSDGDVKVALSDFLSNAALAASIDTEGDKASVITISTMHAAKGLEWSVVFVPACYHGSIPHSRSEDHDEERRLLYVAMTRAQVMLYLSCPLKDSQRQETSLSAFVAQSEGGKFFDEQGPQLHLPHIQRLAQALRRPLPDAAAIRLSSARLLRDHDDFWPVDGSLPLSEPHTSYSAGNSSTKQSADVQALPNAGFGSVRSRYDSLEQQGSTAALSTARKQDAKPTVQSDDHRGKISTFFMIKSTAQSLTTMQQDSSISRTTIGSRTLGDITNVSLHQQNVVSNRSAAPARAPRSEPLHKRQKVDESSSHKVHDPYTMFSSSPARKDQDQEDAKPSQADDAHHFKTASTTHLTSYRAAVTGRKTLGVRRSMNGWANRGQGS